MQNQNATNQTLKEFIDRKMEESPHDARGLVRRIKQECGISNYVYANWRAGRTKIGVPEQKIINSVVGSPIFMV